MRGLSLDSCLQGVTSVAAAGHVRPDGTAQAPALPFIIISGNIIRRFPWICFWNLFRKSFCF